MYTAKNISIFAIFLWVFTIGAIATMMTNGHIITSDDHRVAIKLTKSDKCILTTEMRSFLTTIMLLNQAVAENRLEDISKLAGRNGMQEVELVPPSVLIKLPLGFKQLDFQVHKMFDALAKNSKDGITAVEVNQAIGDIVMGCLSCHNSYQLVLEGK